MRFYETIYIVDPNLENAVLEKTMLQIGKELEKTQANIINHRDWGKKRLAYPVSKHKYGSFILLQFEIDDLNKIKDFDSWLKLNNSVLRHMTILLNQKPEKYVDKSKNDEPIVEEDSKLDSNNDIKVEDNVEKPLDTDTNNK
tara:strand:+ start:1791 stop:2216 length:426 start_codon:yes stop_codon:yes gene_type:complete